MKLNMKTTRLLLRFFSKMPVWLYEFALKQARSLEPPKRLTQNRPVDKGNVNGVNYVWINKERAQNGVVIQAHGGGYTAGPFEATWEWLCVLTDITQTAGVMVDYRKGGTAPYPAAPNDMECVIEHLKETAEIRPGNWSIAGDSAGGGLALVLTKRQLDKGFPPSCVIALSPFMNLALDHPETQKYEPLDISVSRKLLSRSVAKYANGQDLSNPELSPVNLDVADFPPVSLCAGTHEMFLPDIRAFKEKLESAGVELEYHEELGAIHAYAIIVNSDESRRSISSHTKFLKKHLVGLTA